MSLEQDLLQFIASLLLPNGKPVGREESLFLSGRLDSLAAVRLVDWLEVRHGVDLHGIEFDVVMIDTIQSIMQICAQASSRRRPSANKS